ncbi:magnesium-transporting ATPase, partial [filamentous cyanobacterium CCP1]
MTNDASPHEVSLEQASHWHSIDGDRVIVFFTSDGNTGLMPEQVAKRQAQYGPNELKDLGGRNAWAILLDQFKNIMLIMLIAVAIISGILDALDWQEMVETGDIPFKDTIAILAIVILNGILGYVQESKAEKALAALKSMTSPRVRVIRAGKGTEVAAKELVPGDVMLLEAGVQIAADGRLLEAINLQVREAALTGEAHAVSKQAELLLPEDTPVCDRLNSVFQGTEVVQGRATVLVTHTGMQTELGKIATMLQTVESEPTPLQRRMDQLSQVLVSSSLTLVGLVVIGGLLLSGWGNFRNLLEVSLSMAVAVVPEGLPAVITVTLALGTQRMVRRHALIRKLPAVETLGSVTHICSDKTGTLTQNKMVVQSVHPVSGSIQVTGQGYNPEGAFYLEGEERESHSQRSTLQSPLSFPFQSSSFKPQQSTSTLPLTPHSPSPPPPCVTPVHHADLHLLLLACTLCNDAVLQKEQGEWIILGDPTEGALLVVAGKAGLQKDQCAFHLPRVLEFPFSSERKRMSVIVEKLEDATGRNSQQHNAELPLTEPASFLLFCKGSPEFILERCHSVQFNDRTEILTPETRD